MPNRLALEGSPYLRQHADNPVDWYPWGTEALQKARAEDKPIFLSIGYAACHWCHVMAHESFEDAEVAGILNQHFVSIKVDREERPDLDRIYMAAVQAFTGRGGWPMSVFLTPDAKPFYAGTYFPLRSRFGMPGFPDVLRAVADAWRTRRAELESGGEQVVQAIAQQMERVSGTTATLAADGRGTAEAAYRELERSFDRLHGGWGGAPKFPQPMVLEFLLRYNWRTGEAGALEQVRRTLGRMARGGIYDQLGGGFHRYSVDERWQTPHFEKMLYDNAQLARVYLHAWQATGEALFRTVAEETLDYLLREMADTAGGFTSSQDADSEGAEGRFYLWTPDEVRAILGAEAERFEQAYGLTEEGNFEGRNILTLVGGEAERQALADARRALFEARERRVRPARDDKVITAWNGLLLAALAEAVRALGRDDYQRAAERNAEFLLGPMRASDGRLRHVWVQGRASHNGFLEDYAAVADGLIELYQTTFDPRWYQGARELTDAMFDRFAAADGGFYDTAHDHEALIVRPREMQDNALPCGSSMAAFVLLRVAGLAAEPTLAERGEGMLRPMLPLLAQYPLAFGQWLVALEYTLAGPFEVALVGPASDPATRALLDVCRRGYRPALVVGWGAGSTEAGVVPLLAGRAAVEGQATAYVCRRGTCRAPVVDPEALAALLDDIS